MGAVELTGETFTDRCRRMLTEQPDQVEFNLSRAGLELLVLDSERYAASNQLSSELLLTARQIASDTTMFTADSDEFLKGGWDRSLPQVLRQVANHTLKTIGVQNREQGIGIGPGLLSQRDAL